MAKRHVKALYGRVALNKSVCAECGHYAIVLDGKTVCCDASVEQDVPRTLKKETIGRVRRHQLTDEQKAIVLLSQENRCFYCECDLDNTFYMSKKMQYPRKVRTDFDHILPYSFCEDQNITNFVAACNICNMLKTNKVFDRVEAARAYVLSKRERLGYEIL